MAKEWIRWPLGFSRSLPVLRIAGAIGCDPQRAAALCMEMWEWIRRNHNRGRIERCEKAIVSSIVGGGVPLEFVEACVDVGWIAFSGGSLIVIDRGFIGGEEKYRPPTTVYFIQNAATHHIKIGCTRHLERRLNELQTSQSADLLMLGAIEGSPSLERSLHQRFAFCRVSGEWFEPHETLLALIKDQCGG